MSVETDMDESFYSVLASVVGVIIVLGTFGSMVAPWLATKITCKNRGDMYPEGHSKKRAKAQ